MALRNDHDDYGWAMPQNRRADRDKRLGLHDNDQPTPDCTDTILELVTTAAGIVGVFFIIITLVKVFA